MEAKRSPWITVGGILLGLLGIWMCITSVGMYRYLQNDAVTVDAQVSRIETVQTDSGTVYDVYIRYERNGAPYESRYARVNESDLVNYYTEMCVQVLVDRKDPANPVEVTQFHAWCYSLAGSLLVGLGAMAIPLHITPKTEGPYIGELTQRVANRKRYRILVVTPFVLALLSIWEGRGMLVASILLLCLGVLDTVRFIRDLRAATRGEFALQKDQVTGQRMRSSESALFCTLILSGKRRYTHQIPKTVYSSFVQEESVTALYLTGKRPEALVNPQTQQMI